MYIPGITGLVQMDDNADRQPDFWLWYNGPDVEVMTPFMELVMTNPEGEVWASYQIRKIVGCACAGNAGSVFPATDFKRNR